MPTRLLILLAAVGVFGCAPSQPQPTETALDPELSGEYLAVFESAYQEYLTARMQAQLDTVAARRALNGFRRARELDPYQHNPISLAADLYVALGLPDSAVVVLERGYAFDTGTGEMIGYVRYRQGREGEARTWFKRTLSAVEAFRESDEFDTLSGFDREAFEGGWVRLLWLAEGNAAARRALTALPGSVRRSAQVQYAECLVATVSVSDYISEVGFDSPDDHADFRPQSDEVQACTRLLFE